MQKRPVRRRRPTKRVTRPEVETDSTEPAKKAAKQKGASKKADGFDGITPKPGLSKPQLFAWIRDALEAEDFATNCAGFSALHSEAAKGALLAHAKDPEARDEMVELVSRFTYLAGRDENVAHAKSAFEVDNADALRTELNEASSHIWRQLRSEVGDRKLMQAGADWAADMFDAVSANIDELARLSKKEMERFRQRAKTTEAHLSGTETHPTLTPGATHQFLPKKLATLTAYDDSTSYHPQTIPTSVLLLSTEKSDVAAKAIERLVLDADRAIPKLRKLGVRRRAYDRLRCTKDAASISEDDIAAEVKRIEREGLDKHHVVRFPADVQLVLEKLVQARQRQGLDRDTLVRSGNKLLVDLLTQVKSPELHGWITEVSLRGMTRGDFDADRDGDLVAAVLKPGPDPTAHIHAALALALRVGRPEALPVVREGLESDDLALRQKTLSVINQIAGPAECRFDPRALSDFVPLLENYLDDDLDAEGIEALRALGAIAPKTKGAVDALMDAAQTFGEGGRPSPLQVPSLKALAAFGPEAAKHAEALETLAARFIDDGNSFYQSISREAQNALDAAGQSLGRSKLVAALSLVEKQGSTKDLAHVARALKSGDDKLVTKALDVLDNVARTRKFDPKALSHLVPILASLAPDAELSPIGVRALGVLGHLEPEHPHALERLAAVAFQAAAPDINHQEAQRLAIKAVGAFGDMAEPYRGQLSEIADGQSSGAYFDYAAKSAIQMMDAALD